MMARAGGNNQGESFGEKSFYLDEFRRQTVLIVVPDGAMRRPAEAESLVVATAELCTNGTRLLLVWGVHRPRGYTSILKRVQAQLSAGSDGGHGKRWLDVPDGGMAPITMPLLRRLWTALRGQSLVCIRVAADRGLLADFAQRLAVRLGIRKLVLVDPAGGIANETGLVSFMDGAMLEELLRRGEAEWAGVRHRKPVLKAIYSALHGGVSSVNLCDLPGVARELFTYEGAGTLFTLEDYCRVERLRVDDFLEVEQLLQRGQREGYLRVRSPAEITEILMSGYGATIGSGRHLAGVCALATDPYRSARAGEIVGLYTITRFKGEGVGGKLLARAVEDARQLGLRYVFACTTHDRARAFFERQQFRRVTPAQVPARKWQTHSAARRRAVSIYRLELAPTSAAGRVDRRRRQS